jgi:hypothetical protein
VQDALFAEPRLARIYDVGEGERIDLPNYLAIVAISATAKASGHPLTAAVQKQITEHALATGFSHGFLVSAAIGLLALSITLAAIRVTRQDLSGVDPMSPPVG